MILSCPNCNTRFTLDASAIGPQGRKVRCGTCQHVWRQERPADAPAETVPQSLAFQESMATAGAAAADEARPSSAETAPDSERAASADSAPRTDAVDDADADAAAAAPSSRRRFERPALEVDESRTIWPALIAWLLFLAMIAAIIAGGYRFRQQFVDLWPPAVQLYELLELDVVPPPGYGLQIEVGEQSRTLIEGGPALVVKGAIRNVSDRPRRVTTVQGTLFNAAGLPVQTWEFAPNKELLAAGESIGFETNVVNPSPAAARFELNFGAN